MPDLRAQPRWKQRLVAWWGSFYWLPCPICGQPFGGQEAHGALQTSAVRAQSVCLNCLEEAERRNRATADRWPTPELTVERGGAITIAVGDLAPGEMYRLAVRVTAPRSPN